jgi:hypothetical protein
MEAPRGAYDGGSRASVPRDPHPPGIFVRADSKGVRGGVGVRADSKELTAARCAPLAFSGCKRAELKELGEEGAAVGLVRKGWKGGRQRLAGCCRREFTVHDRVSYQIC